MKAAVVPEPVDRPNTTEGIGMTSTWQDGKKPAKLGTPAGDHNTPEIEKPVSGELEGERT